MKVLDMYLYRYILMLFVEKIEIICSKSPTSWQHNKINKEHLLLFIQIQASLKEDSSLYERERGERDLVLYKYV